MEPSHKAKVRKGVLDFISAETKSTFYASVICCSTCFSRACYPGHKSNSQWLRTELCPMWIHRKPQDNVDWVKQAPVIIAVGFFLAELAGILDHSASHWSFLFIDYWIIRALPLRNKQHLMLKCSHKFPSWEFLNYAQWEYSSGQSVQMDALKYSWLWAVVSFSSFLARNLDWMYIELYIKIGNLKPLGGGGQWIICSQNAFSCICGHSHWLLKTPVGFCESVKWWEVYCPIKIVYWRHRW